MSRKALLLMLFAIIAAAAGAHSRERGEERFVQRPWNVGVDDDLLSLQKTLSRLSRVSEIHTGDLPEMRHRSTIRVLTSFSPTNYFLQKGKITGFEYSLLREYEKFLNRGKSKNEIGMVLEFIPLPENQLIPALVRGLGDVAAAGFGTALEHPPEVTFTDAYLTGIHQVVVGHRKKGNLRIPEDLSGKQVYVRPAQTGHQGLALLNEDLRSRGMEPAQIVPADEFLNPEDLMELVHTGIIDFALTESHLAELWSGMLPQLKILDVIPERQETALAWMVRRSNPRLKDSLDQFLKTHKKGTLLGNIYFNRYFKNTRRIRNPLSSDDRIRFSRYASLFKKYGAIYGIDWKLLAALAYQESGLDPNSKSDDGAVGLMQILPSTAADSRINIADLHLPENNIHAGAKYLALMRDTYFDDVGMSPDARVRYALAAYNAGPVRIRQSRNLAAQMGYDPNRWFRNGERGALQLLGHEPVRYVSNINKYYLAYSLSSSIERLKAMQKHALLLARRQKSAFWELIAD